MRTCDLSFIKCHLTLLPQAITSLEESRIALTTAVKIVNKVMEKIDNVPAIRGQIFKNKIDGAGVQEEHPVQDTQGHGQGAGRELTPCLMSGPQARLLSSSTAR